MRRSKYGLWHGCHWLYFLSLVSRNLGLELCDSRCWYLVLSLFGKCSNPLFLLAFLSLRKVGRLFGCLVWIASEGQLVAERNRDGLGEKIERLFGDRVKHLHTQRIHLEFKRWWKRGSCKYVLLKQRITWNDLYF